MFQVASPICLDKYDNNEKLGSFLIYSEDRYNNVFIKNSDWIRKSCKV